MFSRRWGVGVGILCIQELFWPTVSRAIYIFISQTLYGLHFGYYVWQPYFIWLRILSACDSIIWLFLSVINIHFRRLNIKIQYMTFRTNFEFFSQDCHVELEFIHNIDILGNVLSFYTLDLMYNPVNTFRAATSMRPSLCDYCCPFSNVQFVL